MDNLLGTKRRANHEAESNEYERLLHQLIPLLSMQVHCPWSGSKVHDVPVTLRR